MNIARPAAAVTSLSSIALGIVTLTGPTVPEDHWGTRGDLINALGLLTFAAMALAIDLLPPLLSCHRLGRAGCRVAQAGLVAMAAESVASQTHGGNTLGPLFLLGLVASLAGLILVAIDGLRQRRWMAAVPFLALSVAVGAGDHGGFLLLGLAWAIPAGAEIRTATASR